MEQRNREKDQEVIKEKLSLQSSLDQLKQEKVLEKEVRKEKDTKIKVKTTYFNRISIAKSLKYA